MAASLVQLVGSHDFIRGRQSKVIPPSSSGLTEKLQYSSENRGLVKRSRLNEAPADACYALAAENVWLRLA